MEIVIIALLTILIMTDIYQIYLNLKDKTDEPVPIKPKLTREEKEKQKQLRESFDNLMKYDENEARHGRK